MASNKMKKRWEKKISYEVAKEFWDNSSEYLRYKMVYDYLRFVESCQGFEFKMSDSDYKGISKCSWKEIPIYNYNYPLDCPLPNDVRLSVCYYLGIGFYGHRKSSDIQYQREYKLRLNKI